MPNNSRADVVRLQAEQYGTKSNVKLGGFQPQLQASNVSSHTEELWYNETVCLWINIYIYLSIYIYIYIYIYIVDSEDTCWNFFHRKKWTPWLVFKSRSRLFTFHILLKSIGKVIIQLFSFYEKIIGQTRPFKLDMATSQREGKFFI